MGHESDRAWLTHLFRDHHRTVRSYAIRRCASVHDAEDVVSEVFLQAWRRRGEVREPALPWLLGVARLKCQEASRSRFRRERLRQRVLGLADVDAPDPAETHAARHLSERMLEALMGLAEHDRELLLLLEWDQLPVVDIAEILGLRPGAVRVRAHRVRRRFSALYRAAGPDPAVSTSTAAPVALER